MDYSGSSAKVKTQGHSRDSGIAMRCISWQTEPVVEKWSDATLTHVTIRLSGRWHARSTSTRMFGWQASYVSHRTDWFQTYGHWKSFKSDKDIQCIYYFIFLYFYYYYFIFLFFIFLLLLLGYYYFFFFLLLLIIIIIIFFFMFVYLSYSHCAMAATIFIIRFQL